MPEATRHDLVRAKRRSGRLRVELLRRRIIEGDPAEGHCRLMRDVLGLQVLPFHERMIEFDYEPNHESLSLAGRGYGKSTVLTIARSIREVLKNPNVRILIASKTSNRASDFLREIANHLRFNQTLVSVFGMQYDHDRINRERIPWSARELTVAARSSFSKEPNIQTTGIGGQVQGGHYDLIFGDDLVAEENSQTEGQRTKLENWYGKSLYPTIDASTTQVRFRGTRFHPLDLYGKFIEEGMPHQVVRSLGADGSTPWPEKFSVEFLEGIRERRGSAIFNAQYQNDTELMKGQMFKESWFRYWKKPPEWFDDSAKSKRCGFDKSDSWLGGDPAATKKDVLLTARKRDTDWWTFAIASRHYDESAGDYQPEFYFRYVWRGRVTKNEYIERIVRAYSEYGCILVAMEDVAAQEHLCQDLEAKVPLRRVGRPTDKISRGYALQPFFENGQILFPHDSIVDNAEERDTWRALREELMLFPDAGVHDDLFDAVETTVHASIGAGVAIFSA